LSTRARSGRIAGPTLDRGLMTVVPFRAPRRRGRPTPPLHPPAALGRFGPPSAPTDPFDAVEDRLRMQQNLGALVAVLLIVVVGAWLIDRLSTYSRTLACLESGHRSCAPLDIQQPRPW
jgi:hypothetical protein